MKRYGFTLIELVVVVGILGVIMVTVAGVLINSFKAKNRVEVADVVAREGANVQDILRRELTNASGVGVTCAGNSLSFVSAIDGGITQLVCYEGSKIASESANGVFDLTTADVTTSGCNNFVSCTIHPDSAERVAVVNLVFGLRGGDDLVRTFRTNVVVRN